MWLARYALSRSKWKLQLKIAFWCWLASKTKNTHCHTRRCMRHKLEAKFIQTFTTSAPPHPPIPLKWMSQSMSADCEITNCSISVWNWINQLSCAIFSSFHFPSTYRFNCISMAQRSIQSYFFSRPMLTRFSVSSSTSNEETLELEMAEKTMKPPDVWQIFCSTGMKMTFTLKSLASQHYLRFAGCVVPGWRLVWGTEIYMTKRGQGGSGTLVYY